MKVNPPPGPPGPAAPPPGKGPSQPKGSSFQRILARKSGQAPAPEAGAGLPQQSGEPPIEQADRLEEAPNHLAPGQFGDQLYVTKGKTRERVPADKDSRPHSSRADAPSPALQVDPTMAAAVLPNPQPLVLETGGKNMAAGAAAVPLQQLVSEIVAVVPAGGPPSVDIQFDSKVLQGLRVHVSGGSDGVSIRFAAASEQTSALLSRNVDELTQALQARGVQVAAIEIQTAVPAARPAGEPAAPARESERRDSQRQRGGQQDRRR